MFRRYRRLACLVLACFVALLVSASPAIASTGELPSLEPLWKAYPLNPRGERLVKTNEDPFLAPTTGVVEAFIPASDRGPERVVRPTLLCVLFAALVFPLLLSLPRSRSPKPRDYDSDRLFKFSVIGALVAGETLYVYAIYILVSFLVSLLL